MVVATGPWFLSGRGRLEARLEVGDEAVDRSVRHVRLRDDAEERADRHGVALADDLPPEHPGDRALEDVGDLRGLDVHDLLALGDHGAFLHRPSGRACPPPWRGPISAW
jgi:hypothetical protein